MASTPKRQDKVRVQVDLTKTEATLLQHLAGRLSVRSRADLLQQAHGTFIWIVDEMLSGRRIISVEPEALDRLDKFKELSVPAVAPLLFDHYEYLVERPETGHKQLYLKGRNMAVGQLVYKMKARQLNAEEAAKNMNLPLPQVKEALAYYETHQDLIESEVAELDFVWIATPDKPDDALARYNELVYGAKEPPFTFVDEEPPPQNLNELLKETPPEYLAEGYSDSGLMTRAEFMAALNSYETAHKMSSAEFYEKWRRGEMPDDIEFTIWAGLYETYLEGNPMFKDEVPLDDIVGRLEE